MVSVFAPDAARSLGGLADPAAVPALLEALHAPEDDEWVRLRVAESVVLLGDENGIPVLLGLARNAEAKVVRATAFASVVAAGGGQTDPAGDVSKEKLELMERWHQQHAGHLTWDPATRTYQPHAMSR